MDAILRSDSFPKMLNKHPFNRKLSVSPSKWYSDTFSVFLLLIYIYAECPPIKSRLINHYYRNTNVTYDKPWFALQTAVKMNQMENWTVLWCNEFYSILPELDVSRSRINLLHSKDLSASRIQSDLCSAVISWDLRTCSHCSSNSVWINHSSKTLTTFHLCVCVCVCPCRAITLSSAVSSLSNTGMSFTRVDEKEKQQALEEEQARLQALKVGYSIPVSSSHLALFAVYLLIAYCYTFDKLFATGFAVMETD